MKKNLGLRKSWWRWGCGSNKKDEQMDGHEVGIEIGLLEKALVQFTASIPLTLFVSTSGLKKEFKAKREIDPVFPCHTPPPPKKKKKTPSMGKQLPSLKLTYPLKIGLPKRKQSYSNHPFSGAMLVSGRVYSWKKKTDFLKNFEAPKVGHIRIRGGPPGNS